MEILNKKALIFYLVLVLIYILGLLNFFFPKLRFQYPLANQIFMLFLLFIPWILVVNGFLFKRLLLKILNLIFLIIPCLIALPFAFFIIVGIVTSSYQNAFMPIHHLNLKSFSVTAYRTNGGATTAYGIVVQQEKKILPGVLLVKKLYKEYPGEDILIKRISDNVIEIGGKRFVLK